ncbi:NADP-dependent isocitrate dehydrogenase [Microbacterium hominis]|uniref:NADP-dependent isocitrate dehydrogenase n=1 Tax=Microbacterium TaxID=33882 RepID=UPI00168C02D3|nr:MULTISPECIES: NADP-dependent isocitrate dehydrogenase [Microbacterium]QOC27313.1 NADP-dependent isocitrate dehydrogenase [Microbacterium hominis]QOC30389.1 NADP-dependent isocitrate dehydrogenase [Microbacterium hominis]QYF99414.1 NADP-dependent isocitrate dehydrogenase [Microbacterium sp. PAMC21962]
MPESTIIYTHTDEAPALATASFLPIVRAFAGQAGVEIDTRDISLAGRILAAFPQRLSPEQQVGDALAELGGLATLPEANIIKLPNISASIPQLKAAIAELQSQGYDIPDYPDDAATVEEKDIRARYDRIKGSAVNPVLREGNSDRRAPLAVKNYAKKHPHRNKPFAAGSKTRVATMGHDDFKSNEKSWIAAHDDVLSIRHTAVDGTVTVLKDGLKVLPREVVDATFLSAKALDAFLADTIAQAKAENVLYSVHLKATMMKVSDPIIFGHVVRAFFADVFDTYGAQLSAAGLDGNNGLGSILAGLGDLADGDAISARIAQDLASGPRLSYVNSDKGITNLHVPSDVIVDASMPALVRNGGKLWGVDGAEDDTIAVIPDSSYAGVYQAVIDDVIANGPLDPATIGTVPNVGLMAQAAEEYGSHDKTFEIPADGVVEVLDSAGTVLIEHHVEKGDIWRATQAKHIAIMDWVRLAVSRARATGVPAVFWLDVNRAHDAQLIGKVHQALATLDTGDITIVILPPEEATRYTLARLRKGEDTISVTGNVLRDYLTDLFPILEVGTSAKMLSIVPLLAGGGLFETGAGGSAPKHVQQLLEEDYLRWDSLGEFFALAASFEHLAEFTGNAKAKVLADTLDAATGTFLEEDRSPGRSLGTIDNRGSHFYLGLYWAQELARQSADAELAAAFAPVAEKLAAAEQEIVAELNGVQGHPVDIGGYYHPDVAKVTAVMRPSATLNAVIDAL